MQHQQHETQQEHDSGSAWTSYSDLFMALAVVFLILLVFTLLKSGVTQIKAQKEQSDQKAYYTKGVTPKAVAEKRDKGLTTLNRTIKEISAKKVVIQQSLKDLSQLAESLQDREKVITDLLKRYEHEVVALKGARKTIQAQEQKIAALAKENKELTKKAQRLSNAERVLQIKTEKLSVANKQQSDALAESKKLIHEQIYKIKDLEKSDANAHKLLRKETAEVERQQLRIIKLVDLSKQKDQEVKQLKADIQKSLHKNLALANENKSLEHKNTVLSNLLEKTRVHVTKLEQENTQKGNELVSLRKNLVTTKLKLDSNLSELEGLTAKHNKLKSKNQQLTNSNQELGGIINGLKSKLNGFSQENENLKGLNAKLKAQSTGYADKLNDLQKANLIVIKDLDKAKKDNRKLNAEIVTLNQDQNNTKDRLGRILNEKNELQQTIHACREDLAQTKSFGELNGRKLASIEQKLQSTRQKVSKLYDERKSIAADIEKALSNNGFEVVVDPTTGVVTLSMDESFYFQNNSAQLSEIAKAKLQKIIPLYAKTLLGNSKYANRIARITITGFASPTYKKVFVDPKNDYDEAYEYNLSLSMDRAEKIASYIFGEEIGNYTMKSKLKNKTTISGAGYTKPIRALAGIKVEKNCGPFDCAKSRRVEFNFILKDEKEIDKKLLGIGANI